MNDYLYDTGINNTTPPVTATNVLGRLAKATSPTSSVSFSYDPFGRVNAQVFVDLTTGPGNIYVEKRDYHGDGSPTALHLLLPDTNNFADEHVDYPLTRRGVRAQPYTPWVRLHKTCSRRPAARTSTYLVVCATAHTPQRRSMQPTRIPVVA